MSTVLTLKPRISFLQQALTERQEEVLALIVGECLSQADAAMHLNISHRTIMRHMEDIHHRLGLTGADRFKLARWYWRRKFNYVDELI